MLAITLGDPLSVNIEVISKLLDGVPKGLKVVLVGSYTQWFLQAPKCDLKFNMIDRWNQVKPGLNFFDICPQFRREIATLLSVKERGTIAVNSLRALKDCPNLDGCAVLTSPIYKSVCSQVGFEFPGQTEFFQDLGDSQGIMILAGPKLRVGLVTNHLPLSKVSSSISEKLIESKYKLFHQSLQKVFHIPTPRIAIVGLNPHCGDHGMFGDEDDRLVRPVCQQLSHYFQGVVGPIPADTAFFRGYQGEFDGILAMYHDQGLGPLKTVHFYDAVNITGGLDFLRVSPDHGPAADKFGQGAASSRSFSEALTHCLRYLGYEYSGS